MTIDSFPFETAKSWQSNISIAHYKSTGKSSRSDRTYKYLLLERVASIQYLADLEELEDIVVDNVLFEYMNDLHRTGLDDVDVHRTHATVVLPDLQPTAACRLDGSSFESDFGLVVYGLFGL